MKLLTQYDASIKNNQSCCCSANPTEGLRPNNPKNIPAAIKSLSSITKARPSWITGILNTSSGLVPVVTPEWSRADLWGRFRSRISAFRMNYSVNPGLYAIGSPDNNSDIFVSANYKLSFDILRRELKNINGWILVLDTKGINVWCAAGKGTFGTDELIKRIQIAKLADLVSHRRIIVPQLGATGVRSSEVRKKSGFTVYFGPVEARDIREYLESNYNATPEMRKINFSILKRLILTPIELNQAFRSYPLIALGILAFFGLQPSGILFRNAWFEGWPYLLLSATSILAGGLVTPVLLPFIPSRSFAVKGWLAGAAIVAPVAVLTPAGGGSLFLMASELAIFPLLSSYLALNFTGATTFTGISGVKKELKIGLPVYIAGAAVSLILLVLYKIQSWGII